MRRLATFCLLAVITLASGHAIPSANVAGDRSSAATIVWIADAQECDLLETTPSRPAPTRKIDAPAPRQACIATRFITYSLFQRPPPPVVSV